MQSTDRRLLLVKVVHTIVWAFFAACIIAIPISGWRGRLGTAGILCGVVFGEVVVLALNRWRCPLTPVAARYTTDRRDNFDIFLPEWLARHNKTVFGSLYLGGVLYVLWLWLG
jgi:hypothetical protein